MQEYYKNGYINCPDSQSVQELRETCDYFMVPFSEKTVKTNNLSMCNIIIILCYYELFKNVAWVF